MRSVAVLSVSGQSRTLLWKQQVGRPLLALQLTRMRMLDGKPRTRFWAIGSSRCFGMEGQDFAGQRALGVSRPLRRIIVSSTIQVGTDGTNAGLFFEQSCRVFTRKCADCCAPEAWRCSMLRKKQEMMRCQRDSTRFWIESLPINPTNKLAGRVHTARQINERQR